MSWLNLTMKQKKLHKENLVRLAVDYEKYVCLDSLVMMRMLREMGFTGELDDDNNNQETCPDQSMTLVHGSNKYGRTFRVFANLPGFASWEMFMITSYSDSQAKLFKSEGSIDFRGAYFHFKDIMREQAPEIPHFYDRIRRLSNLSLDKSVTKPLFRRNRIDVAVDVRLPVDQKWEYEYIVPSKNSKRIVHHYNFKKELSGWQSFSYIPKGDSRGIGIRIYNKVINIIDEKKQSWYPNINVESDTVTRLELVYYTPYAENDDEAILSSATSALLGT